MVETVILVVSIDPSFKTLPEIVLSTNNPHRNLSCGHLHSLSFILKFFKFYTTSVLSEPTGVSLSTSILPCSLNKTWSQLPVLEYGDVTS